MLQRQRRANGGRGVTCVRETSHTFSQSRWRGFLSAAQAKRGGPRLTRPGSLRPSLIAFVLQSVGFGGVSQNAAGVFRVDGSVRSSGTSRGGEPRSDPCYEIQTPSIPHCRDGCRALRRCSRSIIGYRHEWLGRRHHRHPHRDDRQYHNRHRNDWYRHLGHEHHRHRDI